MAARSPSAKRPAVAACPSAQSMTSDPCSAARARASAIFVFTRVAPAAAASVSQSVAPGPSARNSASPALVALGRRASAPGDRGG